MSTDKRRKGFDKPDVDEEMIMNIMSGNQTSTIPETHQKQKIQKEIKPREKHEAVRQRKWIMKRHFWSIVFHPVEAER